jgi:hypothetical protein
LKTLFGRVVFLVQNILCGVLEEQKSDEPVTDENIRIPGSSDLSEKSQQKGDASRPCIEDISPDHDDNDVEQQID